jgi:hypothetical protein
MTDDMIRLGMRAVECKGWKWLPGMLYQYREESDEVTVPTKHYWCDPTRVRDNDPDTPACSGGLSVPDLTDPATVGCLLALVREAWGDSEMHMTLGAKGWVWLTGESRVYDVVMPINAGATEAEALVAALESAL